MVEKSYLEILFLLICAGCTAAQELPKNCTTGVRHREKLTWLNISTLPNDTMTCLANLQKQEVELERYREVLMDVRNLINKRRRTRGQKSLPETEFEMIPEGQECLIPMFCNGKALWGQFFVRDPATGEVTTKCRYEVDRARARLHIMEAEYKLIAPELSEELKMIPTAVSPTANNTVIGRTGSTSGVCPPSSAWGPASTMCPRTPREVTSTDANYRNDVSTSVEEKFSTKADHTEENVVTDKDTFSAALTSTASHVLSTKDLTTSPTTETTTKGSCDITFNGICYWTHVQDEENVNFTKAEEICSSKVSTPAHFPNKEAYNAVVEDLRSKIPSVLGAVNVWIGVIIDTNTATVIHPSGGTYMRWKVGNLHGHRTHVVLRVDSDPGGTSQGMYNRSPQESRHGVVCQNVE